MASAPEPRYRMTMSLNVLKHLGLGLYSNVPAVLSEVVANAWDADAKHVSINIDPQGDRITIEDDGHGMSVADTNQKYLHVGYERRKTRGGARTPLLDRPVMGRKGIGKLSLFSIAKTVEVHSIKGGECHGLHMDADRIEQAIQNGEENQYFPDSIDPSDVHITVGTRIILTNMKRQLHLSSAALRRRLARRFSVIGAGHNFEIELDGKLIAIEDRDYYDKLQYIWTYGPVGTQAESASGNTQNSKSLTGTLKDTDPPVQIDGWIGTATEAGQLKDRDTDESINKIVIMVRGKLAQEDILEEFGEAGLYSKYIIGEIHADFLDRDDADDIATTSRQRLIPIHFERTVKPSLP